MTNAAKYGALSMPGGRVTAEWTCEDDRVALDWREEGGPPAVEPKVYGFGSRLIVRTLKTMSGSVEPTFSEQGVSLKIRFRTDSGE